ncbi:hypothetical protein [Mesorhizobium sp.]|uniref:hypothetical protein n=1 Tax=Mesorhizobium sp. TaxID=1871066 RepID=UPI000FE8019B|nr:hypothetical protein [Mesorhizobium sp.]RWC61815.1 MAG: hypothetical protein EOS56_10090 [Mesorhizobium sp.]RWC66406.1 MAG: hypothetical protein EOS29_04950 [Mesorhizobium sp.]
MDKISVQHPAKTATIISRGDLAGVWKRALLADEKGNEDRESIVYWVQGARLCADIREHRRASALAGAFREGGSPTMDAFAGELIDSNGTFRWEPVLRLNHVEGPPDEGRLNWIDGDLWEEGVHIAYSEQWTRIIEAAAGDFAVALDDERGRQAYMLKVGTFLFHALSGERGQAEFSLFELKPGGVNLVLSTVGPGPVACPNIEFADLGGTSVWLSAVGENEQRVRWQVTQLDDCGRGTPAIGKVSGGVAMR